MKGSWSVCGTFWTVQNRPSVPSSAVDRPKSVPRAPQERPKSATRPPQSALGRSRGTTKCPTGPKIPPQRVPKGVRERPKRVSKTFSESFKAFLTRFNRKCKNHQKCCKVLQNSRFGGSKIHLKSSSESITATKMVPRYQSFANLRATFSKNRSKIVQDAPDTTQERPMSGHGSPKNALRDPQKGQTGPWRSSTLHRRG